jgi:hypothetical protein
MKVNAVLFVVASYRNILYMMIIELVYSDIMMYEQLLDSVSPSLNWIYSDQPFPTDLFGDGLNQNGCHVDAHSVRLELQLWKSTHALIKQYDDNPLPPCHHIVPIGMAYWNKTKGFVYVMSRLLSHIEIPFKRGGPVLQLVFRFLSILVINGDLMTKLVKLNEEDFQSDHSYNDIKHKMCNKASFNDYILILASNFELPGCMFVNNVPDLDTVNDEGQHQLAQLPLDLLLNPQEITTFKNVVSSKIKLHLFFLTSDLQKR